MASYVIISKENEKKFAVLTFPLCSIQSTLHQEEEKVGSLEDSVKTQRLELETLRAHLAENRNTIDQYKKDKQTLYQGKSELMALRGYPVGVWGGVSSP